MRRLPFLAVLALIAGALVVFSGVVPVGASSGHWAITNWFLHTAMERSVNTHARGVELPPQPAWAALKGAGHYETGCRPCHGAPDLEPPVVPAAMTPHPPALTAASLAGWSDRELFYIVKHGVKFTAMPAWPSQQRDDEVAAMVAFLRRMPTLDGHAYRRLVGNASAAASIAELVATEPPALASCTRCHGLRGEGRELAAFPRLAGQKLTYQLSALQAYASGARRSGIMQPVAAALSEDERRAISAYYTRQGRVVERGEGESERGAAIAEHGIPSRGVPPCVECHAPARSDAYPQLSGQFRDYLVLQLQLFKQRRRGGSAHASLMLEVVDGLTEDDILAVATHYASLRE